MSQPLAASQLLPVSQPAMHQPLERPLSVHKQSERQTRHHTKVVAVSQPMAASQPVAVSQPLAVSVALAAPPLSLRGTQSVQRRMLHLSANAESGGI